LTSFLGRPVNRTVDRILLRRNWIPARLAWLLLAALAAILPGFSGRKALLVGWRRHAVVPGPNSGWSEAAMAGAIGRKLVGPIWSAGTLVTTIWLGDPMDPPAAEAQDAHRAVLLGTVTGTVFAAAMCFAIAYVYHSRLLPMALCP
jgi:adenosylcobinamide-phosphate synthase